MQATEPTGWYPGPVTKLDKLGSVQGPFHIFESGQIRYPMVVKQALGELFREYNRAFNALIEANREWDTDYQYCWDSAGQPLNRWVQIDMSGLTPEMLDELQDKPLHVVVEALRGLIYEIENSLACYVLLRKMFSNSRFEDRFDGSLEALRERYGKRIALLAVTEGKRDAMLPSEFGLAPGMCADDAQVREHTGFDCFYGPDEFRALVERCGPDNLPLLYVRSSDPPAKLRKPGLQVEHPLLRDPAMRRIIRANAITFNIDDPDAPQGNWINDTKGYMPIMGIGYQVRSVEDIVSADLREHFQKGKTLAEFDGEAFTPGMADFLVRRGVDAEAVSRGNVKLHFKPMLATFGCYGHVSGFIADKKFREGIKRETRQRGLGIVQQSVPPAVAYDQTGKPIVFIDRNFMTVDENGRLKFLAGYRTALPADSHEVQRDRVHGNENTRWSLIR